MSTYAVEFVVQATCVANWFALIVSPPKGGGGGSAVSTGYSAPPVTVLKKIRAGTEILARDICTFPN